MATMGNEIGGGANSAMSAAQTMIQLQSAIAGIDKLNADTSVSEASAGLIRAQQRTELNRPENVIASTELTKKGSEKSEAETRGQILRNEFLRESMEDRLKEISSGARLKQFMAESERLGLSEGRAMSNFWESAVGKASPYINLGTETVNSAVGAVSKALMPSAVRKGISIRRR